MMDKNDQLFPMEWLILHSENLKKIFAYRDLWQIKFLCLTRVPMGILEMDFERILGVPFFHSNSHSIILWNIKIKLSYIVVMNSLSQISQIL